MSSCLIREVLKDRTSLLEAKKMNRGKYGDNEHTDIWHKKCNDTKKAQRYFKERSIKFQFIDMSEKEISKGEFRSVCQAVGGINAIDK